MNDKRDWTADIIKVCAVVTAMPRWVGALLAAEGIAVPAEWQSWWIVASAIFNAAMAVTEGLAFAYVFNAWRVQKDKGADKLLWLALLSGGTFVIVLSPFIAAQVRHVTLDTMLNNRWMLWVWSGSVAASTIVIVASVGYAQKRRTGTQPAQATSKPALVIAENQDEPALSGLVCLQCGATAGKNGIPFSTQEAVNAHMRFCAGKIATNGAEHKVVNP